MVVDKAYNGRWRLYLYVRIRQSNKFQQRLTHDGYADKVFHIHFYRAGDNDEIRFRDYLIAHPEIAKEYEILKLSLLPKYKNDRDGYTETKSEFVLQTIKQALKQ